jgi:DNA-binding NarL/FixJ family response regulator
MTAAAGDKCSLNFLGTKLPKASRASVKHGMCNPLQKCLISLLPVLRKPFPARNSIFQNKGGAMHRARENGYPITLLVAEHCRMNCQLMEAALQRNRHLSVLASTVESAEFLDAFKNLRPNVCIVSSNLKDGAASGFRVTRELRAVNPGARIIILLESSCKPLVIEAFRSGALGVFSRDESFDVLCKCMHKVSVGEVWANNQDLQFMVESLAKDAPRRSPTPRASDY